MRPLFLSLVLILTAMLAAGGITSSVYAVGAPSENFTTPEDPLSDNVTPEIKPSNCILQGASAQSQIIQPSINFDFSSQSGQDRYTVTGNENWELLIDINLPGWVYIYEYMPPDSATAGRWIAYKWETGQSGIWKLGPFIPEENEPAGQHLYRVWYYANGKWAADTPQVPFKELTWTYVEGPPVKIVPVTPPPAVPAKEEITGNTLNEFFTNPVVLMVSPSVLVIIIIFIRHFAGKVASEKRAKELATAQVKPAPAKSPPDETGEKPAVKLEEAPATVTVIARAKLVLPGDLELTLNEKGKVIGRPDLARVLGLDDLALISRRHFEITYSNDNFFIEDNDSANGTSVNGKAIAGQGPITLNDADLIEPADVIKLKFQVL